MYLIFKYYLLCSLFLFQGGYDAGFLYHCEFPPYDKNSAITEMKNEPFDFRRLEDTEDNPIQAITFRWTEFQKALKKPYPICVYIVARHEYCSFLKICPNGKALKHFLVKSIEWINRIKANSETVFQVPLSNILSEFLFITQLF